MSHDTVDTVGAQARDRPEHARARRWMPSRDSNPKTIRGADDSSWKSRGRNAATHAERSVGNSPDTPEIRFAPRVSQPADSPRSDTGRETPARGGIGRESDQPAKTSTPTRARQPGDARPRSWTPSCQWLPSLRSLADGRGPCRPSDRLDRGANAIGATPTHANSLRRAARSAIDRPGSLQVHRSVTGTSCNASFARK